MGMNMILRLAIIVFCALKWTKISFGWTEGEPYGILSPMETECEYQGLTVGSRLADAYNSYEEDIDELHRYEHEFFHSAHLGSVAFLRLVHADQFHKFHHRVRVGHDNTGHREPHHTRNATSHSVFHTLSNKWIFFVGDRTLLTIIQSLSTILHGKTLKFTTSFQKITVILFPCFNSSRS